jgi:hypothetical protein
MSPEAQRIAIAEACGWRNVRKEPPFDKPWDAPLGTSPRATYSGEGFERVPDYLNDLNAMHEAACGYFNGRSPGEGFTYIEHLCRLTGTPFGMSSFALAHATARQRAEAFLRTLNKWDDSK